MGKELFKKRKYEFFEVINREKRLPKVWEFRFSDGEDMRVWFNKISRLNAYKSFLNEVNLILNKYNTKVLSDAEKEEEFLNCISTIKCIPTRGEYYFSDNDDMNAWYLNYKKKNPSFETIVYISLPEYQDFDLVTVWPHIKQEFISILKTLKRVPNYGEIILQNDIDVRVVFDKLKSHDPKFYEKLLLHLQTYREKGLTTEKRIHELKTAVSSLRYIPDLQEVRFSDGTDMFTWYMKYKNILPNLEQELSQFISISRETKKVNIYLIPNFRKTGGKFYTICTNVGEKLDLSNITSYEEAKQLDETFTKRGGLLLKKDEEIDYVTFKKGKSK